MTNRRTIYHSISTRSQILPSTVQIKLPKLTSLFMTGTPSNQTWKPKYHKYQHLAVSAVPVITTATHNFLSTSPQKLSSTHTTVPTSRSIRRPCYNNSYTQLSLHQSTHKSSAPPTQQSAVLSATVRRLLSAVRYRTSGQRLVPHRHQHPNVVNTQRWSNNDNSNNPLDDVYT